MIRWPLNYLSLENINEQYYSIGKFFANDRPLCNEYVEYCNISVCGGEEDGEIWRVYKNPMLPHMMLFRRKNYSSSRIQRIVLGCYKMPQLGLILLATQLMKNMFLVSYLVVCQAVSPC